MNSRILHIFMTLVLATITLTSCSEHEAAGEYDNWMGRNQHFIDSIANVATANADGTWMKIKAFNIGDDEQVYQNQPNNFVYVKKLKEGEGTKRPYYNDTVRVHYCGRLIPTSQHPAGYVFGKSYSTSTLNEATDVPTKFGVKSLTVGFATAVMNMHEGDRWLVYVPSDLAYGKSEYRAASIPPYSTLVFDIQLARVYRYRIDTNTSWH